MWDIFYQGVGATSSRNAVKKIWIWICPVEIDAGESLVLLLSDMENDLMAKGELVLSLKVKGIRRETLAACV